MHEWALLLRAALSRRRIVSYKATFGWSAGSSATASYLGRTEGLLLHPGPDSFPRKNAVSNRPRSRFPHPRLLRKAPSAPAPVTPRGGRRSRSRFLRTALERTRPARSRRPSRAGLKRSRSGSLHHRSGKIVTTCTRSINAAPASWSTAPALSADAPGCRTAPPRAARARQSG